MELSVNEETDLGEYDQLNIICPIMAQENHIIYSVSRLEFDSCRVLEPTKLVAFCFRQKFDYVTKTFRPFSPIPGGLEFKPGHNYYFVSTSSATNIINRNGGYCASHNMKMAIKIANDTEKSLMSPSSSSSSLSLPSLVSFFLQCLCCFKTYFSN